MEFKINQIKLNQTLNQICVAYNSGIKVYSTEDYKCIFSSNNNDFNLGNIQNVTLIYDLNIVVFNGSSDNQDYNNKKLVFFDLKKNEEIYSTRFANEITNIKSILFFILATIGTELNIFLFKNNEFEIYKTINFLNKDFLFYEIWNIKDENNENNNKIYLSLISKKKNCIEIQSFNNSFIETKDKIEMQINFKEIQNIFYLKNLDYLCAVDNSAQYIGIYDYINNKRLYYLYRGVNPGFITSIINIDKNFIAVSNSNRTIHIFDLTSLNKVNINTFFTNLLGKNLIYSCTKIRFKDLISQNDEKFFFKDFNQKGAVLYNKKNSFEFNIIGYNGYVYTIKFIPLYFKYEVVNKIFFAEVNFDNVKEININDDIMNYTSLTEKEKKNIIDDEANQWKII
jgi:hypothetical protein